MMEQKRTTHYPGVTYRTKLQWPGKKNKRSSGLFQIVTQNRLVYFVKNKIDQF